MVLPLCVMVRLTNANVLSHTSLLLKEVRRRDDQCLSGETLGGPRAFVLLVIIKHITNKNQTGYGTVQKVQDITIKVPI